jgi:hypothetical protein
VTSTRRLRLVVRNSATSKKPRRYEINQNEVCMVIWGYAAVVQGPDYRRMNSWSWSAPHSQAVPTRVLNAGECRGKMHRLGAGVRDPHR